MRVTVVKKKENEVVVSAQKECTSPQEMVDFLSKMDIELPLSEAIDDFMVEDVRYIMEV